MIFLFVVGYLLYLLLDGLVLPVHKRPQFIREIEEREKELYKIKQKGR